MVSVNTAVLVAALAAQLAVSPSARPRVR